MDLVSLILDTSLRSTDLLFSFLLVRHPKVLTKLRLEIAAQGSAELTRTDLRNMKYLQNILKESESASSISRAPVRNH